MKILSNCPYQWFSTYGLSKWQGEICECIDMVTTTHYYHWRGYKISENMTDQRCFQRQKIFPRLVCEKQMLNSSSSAGISECFHFFQMFPDDSHQKPQLPAYYQQRVYWKVNILFFILKHMIKKSIIDIFVFCVFCLITLTKKDLHNSIFIDIAQTLWIHSKRFSWSK